MGKHPKTTTNPKYETHRKRLRFIKILLACASSILLISAGVSIGYVVLNNKIASSKSPILVLPKPNSITIHGETEVGCIRGETTTSSYYVMNNFGVVDYDINWSVTSQYSTRFSIAQGVLCCNTSDLPADIDYLPSIVSAIDEYGNRTNLEVKFAITHTYSYAQWDTTPKFKVGEYSTSYIILKLEGVYTWPNDIQIDTSLCRLYPSGGWIQTGSDPLERACRVEMGAGDTGNYIITINFPGLDIISCELQVFIASPDVPPNIKITNIYDATILQEEQVSWFEQTSYVKSNHNVFVDGSIITMQDFLDSVTSYDSGPSWDSIIGNYDPARLDNYVYHDILWGLCERVIVGASGGFDLYNIDLNNLNGWTTLENGYLLNFNKITSNDVYINEYTSLIDYYSTNNTTRNMGRIILTRRNGVTCDVEINPGPFVQKENTSVSSAFDDAILQKKLWIYGTIKTYESIVMFDPNSQPAMYPKNAFGYCFSSVKTNLLLLRWETSCFIPDWSYSN